MPIERPTPQQMKQIKEEIKWLEQQQIKRLIEENGITGENDISEMIDYMHKTSKRYNRFIEQMDSYISRIQQLAEKDDSNVDITKELIKLWKELYNRMLNEKDYGLIGYCYMLKAFEVKWQKKLEVVYKDEEIKDIKNRKNDIDKECEDIDSKNALFENMRQMFEQTMQLLRGTEGIEVEELDFNILTEKYFKNELEKWQNNIQTLFQIEGSGILMTSEERKKVAEQILECKAKILATIMAYSETKPSNPIISLKIGEQEITTDCNWGQLPSVLGLAKEIKISESKDEKKYPSEEYEFIQSNTPGKVYAVRKVVAQALEEEYKTHIFDGLMNFQLVRILNNDEREKTLDEFAKKKLEYEGRKNNTAILLKKYYNLGNVEEDLELDWLHENEKRMCAENANVTTDIKISNFDERLLEDVPEEKGSQQKSRESKEIDLLMKEKEKEAIGLDRINLFSDLYRLSFESMVSIIKSTMEYYAELEPPERQSNYIRMVYGRVKYFYRYAGDESLEKIKQLIKGIREDNCRFFEKIEILKESMKKIIDTNDKELKVNKRILLAFMMGVAYCMYAANEHTIYATLYKHSADLENQIIQEKDSELEENRKELDKSREKLARKTEIFRTVKHAFRFAIGVLRNEKIPASKEKVSKKIIARTTGEQYFCTKLQDLQKGMEPILKKLDQISIMPPIQRIKISDEILQYKAKFLAILMAYSETIPQNQLVCCQIGEKQISLKALLEQLPFQLGIVEKIPANDENKYIKRGYKVLPTDLAGVCYAIKNNAAKVLENEYQIHVPGGLMSCEIVDYPEYIKSNLTNDEFGQALQEFFKNHSGFSDAKDKTAILLNRYCNIGKVESRVNPLDGYEKINFVNPEVMTFVVDTPISKVVSGIAEKLDDAVLDGR